MKTATRKIEIEIYFDHSNRNTEQIDIFLPSVSQRNFLQTRHGNCNEAYCIFYSETFIRNGSYNGICFIFFVWFLCSCFCVCLFMHFQRPMEVFFFFCEYILKRPLQKWKKYTVFMLCIHHYDNLQSWTNVHQ